MEKYFDLHCADDTIRCKMYFRGQSGEIFSPEKPAPRSFRHVILFCHGFAGHKDNAAAQKLAERILEKHDDTALLIFNWPGHGDDAHEAITLEDCSAYFQTVLAYIQGSLCPEILDACATSFGGYLVLKYLSDHAGEGMPFRRLCLRCPAVVMYNVLMQTILTAEELETLAAGGSVPAGFDRKVLLTPAFMKSLKDADITVRDYRFIAERLLIVQGMSDEIVPFEAVRSFAEKNGIRFIPVEGADHRFLAPGKMDIVIKSFMDFLGFNI